MVTKTPSAVFRGDPISALHEPNPSEVVTLMDEIIAQSAGGGIGSVTTRAALAALAEEASPAYLAESGRSGVFEWDASNLSTEVAADTLQGVYVAPSSDATGASGAWVRRSPSYLNASWFGADPSGTSDSKPAIQAAVDLATVLGGAGGFAVYLPSGTYRINSGVVVNAAVHLIGDGWYQTRVLNYSSNAHSFYFGATDPTTAKLPGCGVSGMYLQYMGSDPAASHGVYFDRVRDAFARNLKIVNHYVGVGVYGGGETIHIDEVDISGGSNLTGVSGGSACVVLDRRVVATGQGSQDTADSLYYDHPVSVFLSNFNLRGATTTYRPDYGVLARCFDGFYISNGHMGLTTQAAIRFLPIQANLSLVNFLASSVFVDPAPGVTSYGIWYTDNASAAAVVRNHKWSSGVTSGAINDGLIIQDEQVDDVSFSAFRFASNGRHGAHLPVACNNIRFSNCEFQGNNTAASGGHHLNIVAGVRISAIGCGFVGTAVNGVNLGADADKSIVMGCTFVGHATLGVNNAATSPDIIVVNNFGDA